MRSLSLIICTCTLAFVSGLARGANRAPQQETIVLEHMSVIDVTGGPTLADCSVVIAGGRFTALGRTGEVAVPAGAKVVDASGKYAIPGLWDMHVHFAIKSYGALFVANGVTGVRVMWGNPPPVGAPFLRLRFHNQWRGGIFVG